MTTKERINPWRTVAGILLGVEAMWWAANIALVGFSNYTAELLAITAVTLMFLSLLAIFLLVQAPRAGVWFGLALQGVAALQALLMLFFMQSLVGAAELPLAVVTTLCLAAAAPGRSRP